MKRSRILQGCGSPPRASHAITSFTKRILWHLRWFYVKRLSSDLYFCFLDYDSIMVKRFDYNETVSMFYEIENRTIYQALLPLFLSLSAIYCRKGNALDNPNVRKTFGIFRNDKYYILVYQIVRKRAVYTLNETTLLHTPYKTKILDGAIINYCSISCTKYLLLLPV